MTVTWTEITEEKYDTMRRAMEPRLWHDNGFLLGEPTLQRRCRITRHKRNAYDAFIFHKGKYYESNQAFTVAEFRAFDPNKELP